MFLTQIYKELGRKAQAEERQCGHDLDLCQNAGRCSRVCILCNNQEMRRRMKGGMRTAAGRLGVLCTEDTRLGNVDLINYLLYKRETGYWVMLCRISPLSCLRVCVCVACTGWFQAPA